MPRVLMSRSGEDRQALNRELARLPREVTTAITWRMKQLGVNKADLARAMGVSPGRVSQILSGDENITLRTLASVCVALDAQLDVKLVPNGGDPLPGDARFRDSSFGGGAAASGNPGSPWHQATGAASSLSRQ
jgi:transcriptional regulator with XRE-family HTH domain